MSNILKIPKADQSGRLFVRIDKDPLGDKKLSLASKGLLTYIMGLPKGWTIRMTDLAQRSSSGYRQTRSAFQGLEDSGYAISGKFDGDRGETSYVVAETKELMRAYLKENPIIAKKYRAIVKERKEANEKE